MHSQRVNSRRMAICSNDDVYAYTCRACIRSDHMKLYTSRHSNLSCYQNHCIHKRLARNDYCVGSRLTAQRAERTSPKVRACEAAHPVVGLHNHKAIRHVMLRLSRAASGQRQGQSRWCQPRAAVLRPAKPRKPLSADHHQRALKSPFQMFMESKRLFLTVEKMRSEALT